MLHSIVVPPNSHDQRVTRPGINSDRHTVRPTTPGRSEACGDDGAFMIVPGKTDGADPIQAVDCSNGIGFRGSSSSNGSEAEPAPVGMSSDLDDTRG